MKIVKQYLEQNPVVDTILRKFGVVGLALFSLYIGYSNHSTIARIEDSLYRRNVPIESDAFPDPAGISTKVAVNGNGNKEGYLIHEDMKIAIGSYLAPKTPYLLDVLGKRVHEMSQKEAKTTLDKILDIERDVYKKW